jgi:photosynthetic reaction center H subunit
MTGAITETIDAEQILVAAFFLFFAFLIYYLRREDKREGYPLVDISPVGTVSEGFPATPEPKIYTLLDGGTTQMPHDEAPSRMMGQQLMRFAGAPLVPLGDPLLAEIGPGAYPMRKDEPMLNMGTPQVQPLRVASEWHVPEKETDPRGMIVVDGHYAEVGVVRDLWVDRGIKILRYLEVELTMPEAEGRRILLPIFYADVSRRRARVRVRALMAHQFVLVPGLASMDQITAREEDRVNAFYAGGQMFSRGLAGGLPLPGEHVAGSVA